MEDIVEQPRFLLVKRDLYYMPNSQGYTGIKDRAGRYFESDALPDCDVIAIHENDAPMFSKACWEDVKVDYLLNQIKQQAAENERLRDALRFYAGNLGWPNNAWVQPVTVDARWPDNHKPDGPPVPSDTLRADQGKYAKAALAAQQKEVV